MKKITGIIFSILLTTGSAFAADVEVSSRVSQVTVYSSRAFVTRSATIQLNPGDTRVIFPNLIPDIDENSLRVKGKGTAEVKILGVQLKREYTEEAPIVEVQALETKIQDIQDQNERLQNEKQVLAEDKQYLDSIRLFSNQKIPEDLVTKMPSVQELEATLVFLDAKLRENFSRGQDINIAVRKNEKKLQALWRELEEIAGPAQKIKRSIVVDIEVVKAGDLNLDISYIVYGASWNAIYDARADFDKSEVELVSYGVVQQNTGEDWNNVDMTLSTAQVTESGEMPELNSWFIWPYQPPIPAPVAPRESYQMASRAVMSESAAYMMDAGYGGGAGSVASFEEDVVAENVYAEAESKGVSVVYKLARKVTVNSDGSDYKLPISSQTLAASFEYSAYPRVTDIAYLRSRVTNAEDLQLLGGRVNVFLDGDFVGTSSIKSIAPGQEFDLYMGADENVKVKQELLEQKTDNVILGGIPSPTNKVTYKYKLTVENYKTKASKVQVFETIPVSEDERIKVKVSDVSLEPQEKEWENKQGIWRWELLLAPNAKQEIFYTYVVESPRKMRVEGL